MKNIIKNISAIFLLLLSTVAKAEIGQWNTYLAYGDITDIEPAGNLIYVLSSGSLFSYNVNDKSVSTYSKVYPLSDTNISNIAWCTNTKTLVIIYSNQNIDILDKNDNVTNISDYYNKSMIEDKTINNITVSGYHAYLSTGFGILKINIKSSEISATYNLGMNITDCAVTDNTIYAKTSSGIYAGNTSQNLLDKANWQKTSENVSFQDDNDISINTANGYTEYIAYDTNNKCYWSNQKDGKLQGYKINGDNQKTIIATDINPDSPRYNYFGFLKIYDNKLYSCNGRGWDARQPASIQVMDIGNNTWTTYSNEGIAEQYGIRYQDIMTLAVDPHDPKKVMAGSQAGMFEFYDGKLIQHFNHNNSPIYYHYNVPEGSINYEVVTSLLFDNEGNLWVANTGSTKSTILRLNTDNMWTTFSNVISPEDAGFLKLSKFNNNGHLWIYNNSGEHPAIYMYDPATGNKNEYSNFVNEDGVMFNNINGCRTIAEDREGNIWVGLDQGLFVLTEEYKKDPSKGFYQIKIPRNDGTNLADYLLSGIDITAITIDKANRKWIGTNGNGLYVISNDNMVEEKHFTTANSRIISDVIESIAIDDKTGNVYIGTDKGLCSYQSDASEPNETMDKDNVWAYPNPVTRDYNGVITIIGLSFDADVKITTANGTLVASGHSNGGSFLWDGNDLKGKRVASGIYMVQTATSDGSKGTVCKIAIIN